MLVFFGFPSSDGSPLRRRPLPACRRGVGWGKMISSKKFVYYLPAADLMAPRKRKAQAKHFEIWYLRWSSFWIPCAAFDFFSMCPVPLSGWAPYFRSSPVFHSRGSSITRLLTYISPSHSQSVPLDCPVHPLDVPRPSTLTSSSTIKPSWPLYLAQVLLATNRPCGVRARFLRGQLRLATPW